MMIAFSSCKEEDYMVVDCHYSCSPDLLKFVEPIIQYNDENGVEKTITLQSDDFKLYNLGNIKMEITINDNTIEINQNFEDNRWSLTKRYDTWEVKDRISVSYRLKEDLDIDDSMEYTFYHNIFNYNIKVYHGDKLVKMQGHEDTVNQRVIEGSKVQAYLNDLCSATYNFNVNISVANEK